MLGKWSYTPGFAGKLAPLTPKGKGLVEWLDKCIDGAVENDWDCLSLHSLSLLKWKQQLMCCPHLWKKIGGLKNEVGQQVFP